MTADDRIPGEVAEILHYYVYALRDPRDGRVFYVGKGIGDRINFHVREADKDPKSQRAKLKTINDIEESGQKVDLLFLRTGIKDEPTAYIVEQSVIDAFAADHHPLTNLVRGHHSGAQGLATLPSVVALYRAEPCPPIPEPLIMVKIQSGWRPDMNDQQIFEQTCGHWKIAAPVRDCAKYCLGVAYGIVRGAYRIEKDSWFPSEIPMDQGKGLWGFNGSSATELQHVVGTHVRDVFGGRAIYRRYLKGYPGSPDLADASSVR